MADEQFEAALRLILQDELTNALKRVEAVSNETAKGTEKGWKGAFKGIQAGMKKAQQQIQKGQQQIRSGALTMAAGVGMAAPLALAAKAAGTFQDGMAEVATLTDQSAAQITAAFGPIVNETRRAFGKDAQGTIKALYDGFSAGVPKTQEAARLFLQSTGQMALGGKTDMAAAADAITTVKNAWQFEGLSFKEIVDQTFVGVQEGKTTVGELSQSMGQAAATVAGARVRYQEFIGAVAALTSAGVKTPQAMTQISMAVNALNKPSKDAQKAFKAVGAEITPLTLQQRGLAGTLDYLTERINASTTSEEKRKELMNSMFGSIEALKAVTLLAGDANDKFKSSTQKAGEDVGAMGRAADKMREGPMHKYRQAIQDTQIAWETFGTVTAPILADLLETLTPIVRDIADWIEENRSLVSGLAVATLVVAGLTVAFGALKMAMGVVNIIRGVTTAMWSLNAAVIANPIMLLVVGLAIAAAAFIYWGYTIATKSDEVGLAFQYLGLSIREVFNQIQLWIFESLEAISRKLDPFFAKIEKLTGKDFSFGFKANVEEQKKDLEDTRKAMEENLNDTRRIMERRQELEAQKGGKGGGAGDFNVGGITNHIDLSGFGGDIGTLDPQGLAEHIAKETAKSMEKEKKQKNRENIGGK